MCLDLIIYNFTHCFFLGKGKKSSAKEENLSTEKKEDGALPKVKPLQSLDIFAGCGGLSHGLHQSGVAETKWAIECHEPAAKAFKVWQYRLWSFQGRDTKLERFLAINQL